MTSIITTIPRDLNFNNSQEISADFESSDLPDLSRLPLLVFLVLLIVCTVVGNCLVCLAVCLVPRIRRQPYTLLYVSLAVADLFVAVLVMPLALVQLYYGRWPLGRTLCDLFVAADVLSCTASILNLCAISVDRYRAITRPLKYSRQRGHRLMAIYIGTVWGGAVVISVVPITVIGNEHGDGSVCAVNQNLYYQIWATIMSFYLPLAVMIFVYMKILQAAKHIVQQERMSQGYLPKRSRTGFSGRPDSKLQLVQIETDGQFCTTKSAPSAQGEETEDDHKEPCSDSGCCNWPVMVPREKKASVTLGIIMAAFIICWLPFFILAVVRPLFQLEHIPSEVIDFFLWLGYINSFLNPFIYVTFNKDFRKPFREILCCRCRSLKTHLRQEQYMEQYGESKYFASQDIIDKRQTHRSNHKPDKKGVHLATQENERVIPDISSTTTTNKSGNVPVSFPKVDSKCERYVEKESMV